MLFDQRATQQRADAFSGLVANFYNFKKKKIPTGMVSWVIG